MTATEESFTGKSLIYGATLAAGFLAIGYCWGKGQRGQSGVKRAVAKSFENTDEVKSYCVQHSSPMTSVQKKLIERTLNHPRVIMMGAPEIVALNSLLIRALNAKKVIDVGVFTGASSLAAALSLPPEGKVYACDINEEFTREAEKYWREAGVEDKVELHIAPAQDTLQKLLDEGHAGTFDFAFIDADKTGYDLYYELCLKLLRPGGIVAFDNTLWNGKVLAPAELIRDESTLALKRLNEKLAADTSRAFVVQVNVGDGYSIALKL